MITKILPRLPAYKLAKIFRLNSPLPINYTLGLTYACNARCKTCRVYERDKGNELTVEEWVKIFNNIGKSPYWVTFTGGEPFLYKDIVEVYYHLTRICQPSIVNIPTNGLLSDRIYDWVWQMKKLSPSTNLVINISLDHWLAHENDELRGVGGYYGKATDTLKKLQSIEDHNLRVGIHTVISKYNIAELPSITRILKAKLKDSHNYVTEIAELREELNNMGLSITPKGTDYSNAIECLTTKPSTNGRDRLAKLKQAFRLEYYHNVEKYMLTGEHKVPCYAGYASAQIAPDGDVWFCCIKAQSVGNLRTAGYNFKSLWNNQNTRELRNWTVNCYCPMANVSYTNMLLNTDSIIKVLKVALL